MAAKWRGLSIRSYRADRSMKALSLFLDEFRSSTVSETVVSSYLPVGAYLVLAGLFEIDSLRRIHGHSGGD